MRAKRLSMFTTSEFHIFFKKYALTSVCKKGPSFIIYFIDFNSSQILKTCVLLVFIVLTTVLVTSLEVK